MWVIHVCDNVGNCFRYAYSTRDKARKHFKQVRGNIFLPGWGVAGSNVLTGARL